jgi:hypothetical protein
MSFFAALFFAVRNLFLSIFFPNSPETQRRKKLNAIYAYLKRFPHPFLSNDLFIQPDFVKLIFRIYLEVLPIKSIFQQSLMNADIRVSNKFQDLLLSTAFTEEQEQLYSSFSFDAREADLQKESMSSIDVTQRRLKEQVKRFHGFLHNLGTPKLKAMEQTMHKIDALYDFCSFDFYGFFSRFTELTEWRLAEIVENGTMPQFAPVRAESVMKELLDLNFVLKNLKVEKDVIDAIETLHSKVAGSAENKFLFVMQQITTLKTIIEEELPSDTVLNMIRYVKGEPDFEDKTEVTKTPIIADFSERLEARFSADSKKLVLIFQESKIDTLITEAFGTQKFYTFSGYNEETNKHLKNSTALSFDWIRPMELLRTFTRQTFEPNIKQFLKVVLVEGFFIDTNFQKNLGAAFYYCDNLPNTFEEFERMFADDEKCSVKTINSLLAEIDSGADLEKALDKIISEANMLAKGVVQTSVEQYTSLYTNCNQLISDAKKHHAELISNVKVLFSSGKLRAAAANFEKNIVVLSKFLEIMKNYAVLVKMDIA